MSTEFLQLLLLIIIANGAPIIIRQLLNDGFAVAVDFGQKLPDGYPVFGQSKTWRGALAALVVTPLAALLLGQSIVTGLLVAAFALLGDLCSSFIKRRLALESSSMAPLLDQVPESLLPAFMLRHIFDLDMVTVLWLVLLFIIIDLVLSHILFRWGVRNRPY